MFEQAFKNIDDVLWKEAGCTTELDYTEQTSWLLFLKYLDGLEQDIQSPRAVRKLCEYRATLWGALADLFDDDLEDVPSTERMRRFRAALKRPGIVSRLTNG